MLRRFKNAPRTKAERLRALRMESLEGRRLLTGDMGDLAPDHNYLIAEDVNQDFIVSPLDALLVINAINDRGREVVGEGEPSTYPGKTDVNGDGILSAADVLGVINRLNAEGEGDILVSFRHEVTNTSGAPITTAAVGTTFRINVFVRDARDIPLNPNPRLFGVFAASEDLGITNLELVQYQQSTPVPTSHGGDVFDIGNLAFADRLVSYDPLQAGGPGPIAGLDVGSAALGVPNYTDSGEPLPGSGAVSLGLGGQMVLQFTNNLLTGSGDSNPDLRVFEVGDSEEVLVEVSPDGARYTPVGRASAASPYVDIDAFGFNENSRLAFVRLTDIANQGSQSGDSVGADIDAVGALSSVPTDVFLTGVTFGEEFLNDQGANEGGGIQIAGTTQALVNDGDTFTLDTAAGDFTFEFDWDGAIEPDTEVISIRNPNAAPASPLTFAEVGNAMATAINDAGTGLAAEYNGQGVVGLPLDEFTFDAGSTAFSLSLISGQRGEYVNEVKSFLDGSRSPDPAGELLFYSIDFLALTPGTVTFTPNGPERPGSENLLFGDRTPIPNELVMFGSAFNVTISADPTAPVANNDSVSTPEDQALTLVSATLLANDTATAPRTLSVVSIDAISGTTLGTISGSTYTPPANYFGQDVLLYTIQDSLGLQSSATITIDVTPVNDPPVAADDGFSVDEDSVGNELLGILSNDNGGPGEDTDVLTITQLGPTSNDGMVSIISNGTAVLYTPLPAFIGTETFTYTVADQDGATTQATISVDVEPLTLPRARVDRATVLEDSTDTLIDVLANDSANEGEQKSLLSFVQPANGTVTLDNGGTPADTSDDQLVYTPNANFFGTDSFTYVMSDTGEESVPSTGTVTVTVTGVNDPVELVDDTASTDEDQPLSIPVSSLLANDSPGAGEEASQTLTLTAVTSISAGGTVALVGGNVVYTPTDDFNGAFTFTYDASDNGSPISSGTATVIVTVNAVNDNPIAEADSVSTNEDTPLNIPAATLLDNDSAGPSDESEQVLSITGVSAASTAGGTVSLDGTNVTYTPAPNFNGTDTFTYTLSDGASGSATGTVTVTVNPINDAPVPGVDSRIAFKDNAAIIPAAALLANDSPGPANESAQTLLIASVNATAATRGTVVLNADGTITFTPEADFVGQTSFEYVVVDSGSNVAPNSNSAVGTVNVTVQEFLPSSVSGVAWVDETRDGIVDAAERRLGGVLISLTGTSLGQTIQPLTMLTLADGSYSFDGLGPGEYTVGFDVPAFMLDNTNLPNSFDVTIVEPGGVNDSGNNFGVIGLEASRGRMLDQLASRYMLGNPGFVYNGAYFALAGDNSLLWGANFDGYEPFEFMEAVLGDNELLLTTVDSVDGVYTARLVPGQYVMVQDDQGQKLIRVLGARSQFEWKQIDLQAPPVESAENYLAAVDAIYAQEGY